MIRKIFKDRCDGCHQMKVCRGYFGRVLCEECIQNQKYSILEDSEDGQTRFIISA